MQSVIVAGRANEAEVVLRALETGMRRRFIARGILSPSPTDRGTLIRNVPVVGDYGDLERIVSEESDKDRLVTRLILAPQNNVPESTSELLVSTAGRLGIALSRMQTVGRRRRRAPSRLNPSRSKICCSARPLPWIGRVYRLFSPENA